MKYFRYFILCLVILCVMSISCISLAAGSENDSSMVESGLVTAAQKFRKAGVVQLNFRSIDVAKFIKFMSELLDENIIVPPGLTARISVVSSNPIPISEVRQVMLSVLAMNDITLQEMGSYSILTRVSEPVLIDNNNTAVDTQAVAAPQPVAIAHPAPNKMIAATPDQPGIISKEDFDNLVNNPYEEMKKFRMRPRFDGNKPIGIEIQWILNDSILGKLGVQKGDVLRSVNGIPMKNMGDITNATNLLMKETKFDVELLRGNAPTNLTIYVDMQEVIPAQPVAIAQPVANQIVAATPDQTGIIKKEIENDPSMDEPALVTVARKMREAGVVQFNFSNIKISEFIRFIAELLQENIVFTSDLTARISFVSPKPIPLSEVRQLMMSILAMNNLTLQKMGSYSILIKVSEPVSINNNNKNTIVDTQAVAQAQPAVIPQPAATPDQPGIISKEDINNLANNPFEEMKYFRMWPKYEGNEPIGIEIQWIQGNSILGKIGILRGDVLKSVNGIPMNSIINISNAISSLMNGTRIDVEVWRRNAPINLTAHIDTQVVTPVQPAAIPQPVVNQMTAATPDQPGVISKEDINNLMNNPFEEMKRFRMRPKFEGNEPIGIEIQWIQNDSILGKLGVQRGDVLKSVNGIPMKNMGDITNAINSLMNGTRFDVEVLRGNVPTNLTYLVK